jgi:hypothetical protein
MNFLVIQDATARMLALDLVQPIKLLVLLVSLMHVGEGGQVGAS